MSGSEILTTASSVTCTHKGKVILTTQQTALVVGGNPAVLVSDLLKAQIVGCPNANTSAGQVPCTKVATLTAGISSTLVVNSEAVALGNAAGFTNGSGPGPVAWQVTSVGQTVGEAL